MTPTHTGSTPDACPAGRGGGRSTLDVAALLDACPHLASDGYALAELVTAQVRQSGKHFLPQPLLNRLSEIRRRHAARDPFLDAFLDCILDKHDGRYCNRTYLALPLLERLLDDPASGLDPDRMAALLMSDVVRFERRESPAADPPDAATRSKRLRHALRFVQSCGDDRPRPPATPAGRWFAMTLQPVYTSHDESFFIRALQCHEMTFTGLVGDVRAATDAVRAGRVGDAAARMAHANVVFERAAMLFRIVATMRPTGFCAFRQFTQGASAIQSDQYKRFEAACGAPAPDRLRSEAYLGVPVVRAEVMSGQDDLSQACLDARQDPRVDPREWDSLMVEIGRLEAAHQRWKATHRSLAARMLGDSAGSGYTEGVPYLERCLSNRLFGPLGPFLGAVAA